MVQPYTINQLFVEQLSDLYGAEQLISDKLPNMIEVISSGALRDACDLYEQKVVAHREILKQMSIDLKMDNLKFNCPPVAGILQEAEEIIQQHRGNSAVKDAALITIIQRVQHYKMAVYGACRTFAKHLNLNSEMALLQHALNDEGDADRTLTKLAEGGLFTTGINEEACRVKVQA